MQAPLQAKNDSDAAQTDTARTVAQKRVLADNRPEVVAQRKLAELMNNSPRVLHQRALSDAIHNSPQMVAQRHKMNALFGGAVKPQGYGASPTEASPAQREEKTNNTGLPNQLKSGIESLSGMSIDHVKVHYNSDKPAQLQAHAYAQGSEIHVAPGQEQHLPHEAWHVVQQAQGRVRPTVQMKAGPVNDDPSLEKEADMMGEKAAQFKGDHDARNLVTEKRVAAVTMQRVTDNARTVTQTRVLADNRPDHGWTGVIQRQQETAIDLGDGMKAFYRFRSAQCDNHVALNEATAKRDAMERLGSIGRKKVDHTLAGVDNQRDGKYTVYEFDATHDKVLVQHTADDQAELLRYYRWRRSTQIGQRDVFRTVPHFHAATIPKIAGSDRGEWRQNLPPGTFPGYATINGDHHFYYINTAAPTTASGVVELTSAQIDNYAQDYQ